MEVQKKVLWLKDILIETLLHCFLLQLFIDTHLPILQKWCFENNFNSKTGVIKWIKLCGIPFYIFSLLIPPFLIHIFPPVCEIGVVDNIRKFQIKIKDI